jgi:hypothetical protein
MNTTNTLNNIVSKSGILQFVASAVAEMGRCPNWTHCHMRQIIGAAITAQSSAQLSSSAERKGRTDYPPLCVNLAPVSNGWGLFRRPMIADASQKTAKVRSSSHRLAPILLI